MVGHRHSPRAMVNAVTMKAVCDPYQAVHPDRNVGTPAANMHERTSTELVRRCAELNEPGTRRNTQESRIPRFLFGDEACRVLSPDPTEEHRLAHCEEAMDERETPRT